VNRPRIITVILPAINGNCQPTHVTTTVGRRRAWHLGLSTTADFFNFCCTPVRLLRTCTCRDRADEADALNAPIFTLVRPILERNDRFSFNDVAWQIVQSNIRLLKI